jgi:hypothetical protein
VFTVGGGKEYAYGAWAALTKPDEPAGRRIRHLDEEGEAAQREPMAPSGVQQTGPQPGGRGPILSLPRRPRDWNPVSQR